jgi:uncharacterized protein (DUF1684 family)
VVCIAESKGDSVAQQGGSPSWFKANEGVIGPPIAHTVAAAGMLSAMGLAHVLASMGYLSRNWGVVLVLAGYAIPFAVARELVAKRMRNLETNEHKSSDEER